jgi:hypothetical protein
MTGDEARMKVVPEARSRGTQAVVEIVRYPREKLKR